uniref:Uncharacterized protein n=1 Tax=Solanum tuberosum TaxID=4113 RepID=M0ZG94_SOLTU
MDDCIIVESSGKNIFAKNDNNLPLTDPESAFCLEQGKDRCNGQHILDCLVQVT